MGTITYSGGRNVTLSGSSGKDTYVVDQKTLGTKTLTLADPGGAQDGADVLVIVTGGATFGAGTLKPAGDAVKLKTPAQGKILLEQTGAEPQVEILRWQDRDGTVLEAFYLTRDPTPAPGKNWAVLGSGGADVITLPDSGSGSVSGVSAVWGGGGADRIVTSADQAAVVYGGSGADVIRTPGPAAEFYGKGGADTLVGAGGKDSLFGGAGADVLSGGDKADRLSGGGKADWLFGGAGGDRFYGGKGGDTLEGGRGDDRITGGSGADHFVFDGSLAEGRDAITDFGNGADVIVVKNASFDDLTVAKAGSDTRITLPGGTEILLEGVAKSGIDAGDFDFV